MLSVSPYLLCILAFEGRVYIQTKRVPKSMYYFQAQSEMIGCHYYSPIYVCIIVLNIAY